MTALASEFVAAIVWRERNTAQAVFDVESCQSYVTSLAEAAVHHPASSYACDEGEPTHSPEPAGRSGQGRIAEALIAKLTERVDQICCASRAPAQPSPGDSRCVLRCCHSTSP